VPSAKSASTAPATSHRRSSFAPSIRVHCIRFGSAGTLTLHGAADLENCTATRAKNRNRRQSNGHERRSPGAALKHHPGQNLNTQSCKLWSFGMRKNIRRSDFPFNLTPLGSWALLHDNKRYDRAAQKLAKRTGLSLPVAQVVADHHGLGSRGRR